MKRTAVGMIPEEWNTQLFSETFRILNNNTFSRADLNYYSGEFKDIHYGDVLIHFPEVLDCARNDVPFVNGEKRIPDSIQPLQKGDIVIADTAEDETVGKTTEIINVPEETVLAGLHTIPCRPPAGCFAPKWLGYYMNSDLYHNQLLPLIHGTKVSSISKGDLANTVIVIPPEKEQQRIVAVLSDMDALIADLQKLIAKKKDIRAACLQHMFPREGQTAPDWRMPGFTEPWEEKKIRDVAVRYDNLRIPIAASLRVAGTTPYYGANGIQDYVEGFTHDGEFVLVAEDGANDLKNYPVKYVKGQIWVNNHAHVLQGRPEMTDNNFLAYAINQANIESHLVGGGRPKLNAEVLMDIMLLSPNKAEQQQIGEFFHSLDHLIALHQRKLEKYQMIKQGMMEELLTGKVRLN